MQRGKLELTGLETRARELLDGLGVEYIPLYPTRTGFVLDFAIFLKDGRKIDLEIDGEHWHSSKKAKKRDNFRNYMLRREGWKIIRVREKYFDEDFIKLREIVGMGSEGLKTKDSDICLGTVCLGEVWRGLVW